MAITLNINPKSASKLHAKLLIIFTDSFFSGSTSLKYLNNGIVEEISLVSCSKNWVNYVNENINDFINFDGTPATKISIETNQCVGQRDWFSDKPYFEFFTDEKVRFEITPKKRVVDIFNKNWIQRYYYDFYKIQNMLSQANWCTFDLG